MDEDEDGEEDKGDDNDNDDEAEDANKKMSVSLEDLKDALNDDVATTTTDNDSESDFKECSSGAYGDELRCGAAAKIQYKQWTLCQSKQPMDLVTF